MKFYLDESGDFRLPKSPDEHAVGIVVGIVIPEVCEARAEQAYRDLVAKLRPAAFQNGEPKGKLLDENERRLFAEMIANLDGILLCPIILDITSLARRDDVDTKSDVVQRLRAWQSRCKHESMKNELEQLVKQVENLSTPQVLRLATWARCIFRCLQDSIVQHSDSKYDVCWTNMRFEFDPVHRRAGNREEQVFSVLLPAWVTGWYANEPLTTIEEVHTSDHPFIRQYRVGDEGIDIGEIVRGSVQYPSSTCSYGLQIADMATAITSHAVRGLTSALELHDYGIMMTRTIRKPLEATGLFTFVEPSLGDWQRRFYGLPEAIDAVKRVYWEK
jgi:hypothetical protein